MAFAAATLCGGCSCGRSHTPSSAIIVESPEDFAPATTPGATADLILGGNKYPVNIRAKKDGDQVTFLLLDHGEVFESETYQSTDKAFSLVNAADEKYDPPLPLLKFPMRDVEKWSWSGNMVTGTIARKATATISTTREPLYLKSSPHETLKVTVDIGLEANPGKAPLWRQLVFWFEPGAGIIKREFGSASVRQPTDD